MNRNVLSLRLIFTLGCLLVGIAYLYAASGFSVGQMRRPGVGFVPLLIGSVAVLFSLLELGKCVLSLKTGVEEPLTGAQWLKILAFFAVAAMYVGIVFVAGYLIATFAMLILLTKLFGEKTWVKPLIFSALLAYGSHYLFTDLLLVPLP
jgi:hypothetical protein